MTDIITKVGRSTYLVDSADHVFLLTCGKKKEVKTGAAKEQALKVARNLRVIRASAAARLARNS